MEEEKLMNNLFYLARNALSNDITFRFFSCPFMAIHVKYLTMYG